MFEKVVQFNFLPSDYLHETWLDLPQLSNLYCKLQGSLTLYQRSEVLFSLLKLDRTTVSFEDSFIYRRLALLERPVFDHLALKLGLIYLSPILKKNINGALIRSLRISLSEEELFFLEKTADFFASDFLFSLFSQVAFKLDESDKLKLQLVRVGYLIFFVLFRNEPKYFFDRFCLRLDSKLVVWMSGKEKVLSSAEKRQLIQVIIKLLNHIEPSCKKALFD